MTTVYIDVEHDGKTPPTLRLVQLAVNDGPVEVLEPRDSRVGDMLDGADIIVAHNGPGDLRLVADATSASYYQLSARLYDTMVAARHAGAPEQVGLEALGKLWLTDPKKPAALAELKKQRDPTGKLYTWGGKRPAGWANIDVNNPAYREYAAADVHDTRAIYEITEPATHNNQFFARDMELHLALATISQRGIAIDNDRAEKLAAGHRAARDTALAACEIYGIANPGSSQQIIAALPEHLLAYLPETDKGAISVAAKALAKIAAQSPIAESVLEYREHTKLLNTYYDAYLLHSSRIYPSYNVVGAVTGRLSAHSPNIQQLPASVRQCLMAEPGHVFVTADYAAIELKIAALVTGDKQLLADIAAGEDIPALVATKAGVPRKKAKNIIYGRIYGGGKKTLAEQSGASLPMVEAVLHTLDSRYPGVRQLDNKLRAYVEAGGAYVETVAGRRVITNPKVSYLTLNRIIQGTAADVFKDAFLRVTKVFGSNSMWLALHDEIGIMVPSQWADSAADMLVRTMAETLEFKGRTVEITAKSTIFGTHWSGDEQ